MSHLRSEHTDAQRKFTRRASDRSIEALDDSENIRGRQVEVEGLSKRHKVFEDAGISGLAREVETVSGTIGITTDDAGLESWTAFKFMRDISEVSRASTPNASAFKGDEVNIHPGVLHILFLKLNAKRTRKQKIDSAETQEDLRHSAHALGEVNVLSKPPQAGLRSCGFASAP